LNSKPERLRGHRAILGAGTIALAVIATLAIVGMSRSPDDELEALVAGVVDAGAPGVLVRIRDGDDIRTSVAGLAEAGVPVRAEDRFRIGSVTKTFVATVVLQLVAAGRVALDETVEHWLPGIVPGGERITVRQLLGHRTGLFDYVEDPRVFAPYAHRPAHVWKPRTLVELALSHPPAFAPGERYAYSSTNYLLLELIVEAASGEPLRDQLRSRIFVPLGLGATSFEPTLVSGTYVHGHRPPSHQGVVTGPPRDTSREAASWTWGAGAIVSTTDDLDRFFAALLRGRLLSAALLREMEAVRPAGSLRYGLGLAVFPTPCGDAWGHTGNAQGTVTVAWSRKDASRQVVIAVNTYPMTGELEDAVRRLQDAAFCGKS
jgi:D-alanyl-D-alanine carboxypeptidase